MAGSLYESLQIILPELSPALVTADSLSAIQRLAGLLPPIHCAGFECRLGKGRSRVDFQQRILSEGDEAERLREHILSTGLKEEGRWRRIANFCAPWMDSQSALNENVMGCWLEFDINGGPMAVPIPSVFVSVKGEKDSAAYPDLFSDCVDMILNLLLDRPPAKEIRRNIRSCLTACPEGASISDIGFMLSRQLDAVRIVAGFMSVGEIVPYLIRLGWRGPSSELESLVVSFPESLGQIAVSLDVGEKLHPRVGVECFPKGQPADNPHWGKLFEYLVGKALCTREKRDALLAWPGYTEPPEAQSPWPQQLIMESVLGPEDKFRVLGRRLHHVKVVVDSQGRKEAKAYFGFGPLWLETEGATRKPENETREKERVEGLQNTRHLRGAYAGQISAAINAAVRFLYETRDNTGWWREYTNVVEGSDEWVTAYVGTALAFVRSAQALRLANDAWKLLSESRGEDEGWGYNGLLPPDADGTTWALRLARAVGATHTDKVKCATAFLKGHVQADGGLASYTAETIQAVKKVMKGPVSLEGYMVSHACITAAAALMAEFRSPTWAYLQKVQHPRGYWKSYWWCDHEYATSLAAEALAKSHEAAHIRCVQSAVRWALNKVVRDGAACCSSRGDKSAFATSLIVKILSLSIDFESVRRSFLSAVNWLIDNQRPDGSWPPSALMRIPPSDARDPDLHVEGTFTTTDGRGIFTTASVLSALAVAKDMLTD